MKREDVKALLPEITDAQLDKLMAMQGKAVEFFKGQLEEAKKSIDEKDKQYNELVESFEKLKSENASAEDWKNRFETLKAETEEKQRADEEARKEAAETERLKERFDRVTSGKKWTHEAVRAKYFDDFKKAAKDDENGGRSDADIFGDLVKNDTAAFENVTAVRLEGNSAGQGGTMPMSKEQIMAIKNTAERQRAIADNMHLFQKDAQ